MTQVYLDVLFKNWILGGIIRESIAVSQNKPNVKYVATSRWEISSLLESFFKKKIEFHSGDIIVNQGTLFKLIAQNRIHLETLSNLSCYFTHDSKSNLLAHRMVLTQLKIIFVMNRQDANLLEEIGVKSENIRVVYGAIDPKIFFPSSKISTTPPYIYITGDAKGRKNPAKIIELIESSPEFKFIINGRFWHEYLSKSGVKLSNSEVLDFNMERNPELMRNASCFLSLSLHEGGPYPVLEALASGTPVVSTPTGWVPELVSKMNGCVVDFDINILDLKIVLKKMIALKKEVYNLDLTYGEFTWQKLAAILYQN